MKRCLAVFTLVIGLCLATVLPALARADQPDTPRILAIGDSLIAWHTVTGQSIPDVVGQELSEPTVSRAFSGARMFFKVPILGAAGMEIPRQVIDGPWDWVVMNGGGNDLWFGCGCAACDRTLDKLISNDGDSGAIPDLVRDFLKDGTQVLYVGYLRSPGFGSMIENCLDDGNELERRIAKFADHTKGFHFLSNADLVPPGDTSFHGFDRIHPSLKGSAAIGKRVATYIRLLDQTR